MELSGVTALDAEERLRKALEILNKGSVQSFEEYSKQEIDKKFGNDACESRLIVTISASFNEDEACLMVGSDLGNRIVVRNTLYGKEATDLYFKLIGHQA